MCPACGTMIPGGCGPPGGTAAIALSQQLLAEMTGLTRKTVNAHLSALEARGLIAIRYGGVLVRDPDGLRRMANG